MPPERPGISVELLRTAVAEAAARTSIRQVALHARVGVTTLWQFLDGAEPQLKTRRKLIEWYVRSRDVDDPAELADAALAAAALELLTRHLPIEQRPALQRRMLRVLETASGELAPEWLDALRTAK